MVFYIGAEAQSFLSAEVPTVPAQLSDKSTSFPFSLPSQNNNKRNPYMHISIVLMLVQIFRAWVRAAPRAWLKRCPIVVRIIWNNWDCYGL